MRHAVIMKQDDNPVLLGVYHGRTDAVRIARWQVTGGAKHESIVVAQPSNTRGEFIAITTGERIRPTAGSLTKEAYEQFLDAAWPKK